MAGKNIFYAQSGGPTAVINATACGLIEAARQHSNQVGKVYAGHNGILGALHEELIDTSQEDPAVIAQLKHTPASAFGSCRYKLQALDKNRAEYQRIIEVFKAHDIGYFFYNGGNDSQDTTNKISQMSQEMGYPLTCIGLPKTIDNDLPYTDNCPGFGSVAKYVAVSTHEAALDVIGMARTSTKIFILEVMGRHAGWIAAAGGLAARYASDGPHIILFPERPMNTEHFLDEVKKTVDTHGYCVIVASEGARHEDGRFVAESGVVDAFGHHQLGGVAPVLARLIKQKHGYKHHWAVSDYLQRAAGHLASQSDVDQAYALGYEGLQRALKGETGVMLTIERTNNVPYEWCIGSVALDKVANQERTLPDEFITEDGYHITDACREYMAPLMTGEAYPPYEGGLPVYARLSNVYLDRKLPKFA